MASTNVLGVQDAYQLINQLAAQALGGSIQATDLSSFVTVGEQLMQTGLESTLNAIGYVLGRTIFSIRPYRAKLSTLERDPERFGAITRKITYLTGWAEETDDFNTQIDGSKLADGASVDPFKIKGPKAVQLCFPGAVSLQDHYTIFRDQLRLAFSSPEELIRFWEGVSVEFYNMIETQKEQRSRAVLLNRIGANVHNNVGVVDLVYEYNFTHNTSYTRADLLSTYASDFWKFAMARIKIDSDRLTERSVNYHLSLSGYDPIVRHVPKDRQRMVMYSPAFTGAEAEVMSSLFRPEYLNIGDFEPVTYWQSQDAPASVSVTPSILNTTTGEANAGDPVELEYVLGILFDEEAFGVMPKFEYSAAAPFNPAGGYTNLFFHWIWKWFDDQTEDAVVYVLGDVDTVKLSVLSTSSALAQYLTPAFDPDTYEYTFAIPYGVAAAYSLSSGAREGALVTRYINDVYVDVISAKSISAGETQVVKLNVTQPGYKGTTYTVTVSRAAEAKDGGDDDRTEDAPAEETKGAKSKK